MHGEEDDVNGLTEQPEVDVSLGLVVTLAKDLTQPVVEGSKHGIDSTQGLDVVEVTYNVVGVVLAEILGGISLDQSGEATHGEEDEEGQHKDHGRVVVHVTSVQGS